MAETQLSQLPVRRVLPVNDSHVFPPRQAPGTQSISFGAREPTGPQVFWVKRHHGMGRGCTGAEHRTQPSPGIHLFLALWPTPTSQSFSFIREIMSPTMGVLGAPDAVVDVQVT